MVGVAYAKELGAWIARQFYSQDVFESTVNFIFHVTGCKYHALLLINSIILIVMNFRHIFMQLL